LTGRMNAVDGAGLDAGVVLGADARLGDDVRHGCLRVRDIGGRADAAVAWADAGSG